MTHAGSNPVLTTITKDYERRNKRGFDHGGICDNSYQCFNFIPVLHFFTIVVI